MGNRWIVECSNWGRVRHGAGSDSRYGTETVSQKVQQEESGFASRRHWATALAVEYDTMHGRVELDCTVGVRLWRIVKEVGGYQFTGWRFELGKIWWRWNWNISENIVRGVQATIWQVVLWWWVLEGSMTSVFMGWATIKWWMCMRMVTNLEQNFEAMLLTN